MNLSHQQNSSITKLSIRYRVRVRSAGRYFASHNVNGIWVTLDHAVYPSVCSGSGRPFMCKTANCEANKRHYRPCNRTRLFFLLSLSLSLASFFPVQPFTCSVRTYRVKYLTHEKPFDNRVSGRAFCTPLFDHSWMVFMVRALESNEL